MKEYPKDPTVYEVSGVIVAYVYELTEVIHTYASLNVTTIGYIPVTSSLEAEEKV